MRAVILDSGPLSVVTQRSGHSAQVDGCQAWFAALESAGTPIYLPEIADYEVRRELLRTGKTASLRRLDALAARARYLPITTDAMRLAASLWAQSRNAGMPTADPLAIDGDVILAAQALTIGLPPPELIVATVNVRHLARYLTADLWNNITP